MKNVTKILQVLMVSLLLVFAFQSKAQVTLFTEGWETAGNATQTPPAGWAVDVALGSNATWFMPTGTWPTCNTYEGSRFVEFRSFSYSNTTNVLRRTVPISTVGYSNITVDFAWLVDPGYAGTTSEGVTVQWSTTGLPPWNNAGFFMRYAATQQWIIENVTLPATAGGQATLYLAFSFNSNYGNNCHLDIAHIKGIQTSRQPYRNCTELLHQRGYGQRAGKLR